MGYIIYNQDGYMFVAIMASNRLRFATEDLLSKAVGELPLFALIRRSE